MGSSGCDWTRDLMRPLIVRGDMVEERVQEGEKRRKKIQGYKGKRAGDGARPVTGGQQQGLQKAREVDRRSPPLRSRV